MSALTTIVILGGGAAGAKVIRRLSASLDVLKHRLILITPRPEYLNLLGALRLLVDPSTPYTDVFMTYTNIFGEFPGELVIGTATSIEETKFEITRTASRSAQGGFADPWGGFPGGTDAGNVVGGGGTVTLNTGQRIDYNVIVLATGSVWEGFLNFPTEPEEYFVHVESWRRKFSDAQDIIIVGGGPVGIETAGEIKDVYPSKNVTIVQGDRLLLNDVYPDRFRLATQRRLERLGVEIILNDAIKGNPPSETPIKTREGKELACDLLVTARGGGANTGYLKFLKPSPLTERGYINVLPTLEVLYHPGMFALGDIVDLPEVKQLAKISMGHADVVVKNVLHYINLEPMTRSYRGSRDVMAVSMGRNGGSSFFRLWWGFIFGDVFTRYIKSRTLLIDDVRAGLNILGS